MRICQPELSIIRYCTLLSEPKLLDFEPQDFKRRASNFSSLNHLALLRVEYREIQMERAVKRTGGGWNESRNEGKKI